MKTYPPFRFKQFDIHQDKTTMKVGTDGVLLGAWATAEAATKILDIGTGTGLIALMLAQRNETAQIDAVEVDKASYLQAKYNFKISIWANRLQIFHIPIQDFCKNANSLYDLIVANPPYFINSTKSQNENKNQVRHTDSLSFEALINSVNTLLTVNGKFCVILPYTEAILFQSLAKAEQLFCVQKVNIKGRDFKPFERILMQFERIEKTTIEVDLIIQNSPARHDYTADYTSLTKDFYLIM